ncbi:MAG: DNA topoisomerase IV subunit A [Erysipelotrichaceae bacterium]|nr:DNA topoisomerase IV subunit A [Erysipelotrichaceae bacterium]
MAKKEKEIIYNPPVDWELEGIMSDRFSRYSKYVIQERALPDARDGLKPVQRRILYAMDYDGNTAEKPHRKSAKVVGLVIGTFHPHGDTSVYEAMVRLSQDWKVNVPLIDFHGNNGSIDDDPPAAYRYTEVRMSPYSTLLLNDIDKDTVKMTNNYDDTVLEPTVLPASFPLLLVNGATGIAEGYATKIAPHNLNEVIDATIYRIHHPGCSLDDLMQYIKGPDFPTGGIVQGIDKIKEAFSTGRAKVVLRSRTEIVETKTGKQIVITEIPYEVVKSELVRQITDVRINKDLDGITDVRDESGRNGLKILIDLKKDANEKLILNYLFKNTDLQVNFSYNMIAIVNHRPVMMTVETALDTFIDFRKEVVLNRSRYLLDQKEKRMHILEGLMKAISILDEIIAIIRRSKDKADSKKNLIEAFGFTEEQAEAIVTMRLYRLSSTDITLLREEYASLIKETGELKSILSSEAVLKSVIVKELREIKQKYPTPRKTTIEDEVQEIVISKEDMITNENVYISLTRDGYLRRYSKKSYDSNTTLPEFKDGDILLGIRNCETLDQLLIFTNLGDYAQIPIYTIADTKWKDLGTHVSHYVKMQGGEKIVSALLVHNFETNAYILTASKNGMIKKSPVKEFMLQRTNRLSTAMKLKAGDELIKACTVYPGEEIFLVSKDGYYNRYSSDVLNPISVRAMGVAAMNVKGDELADICVLRENASSVMLLTEETNNKRIRLSDCALTSRATKGFRLFKQRKSSPYRVRYAIAVKPLDSFRLYARGQELVLDAKDVSLMDRESTFGKPLLTTDEYFLLRADQNDIEEVLIIDLPPEESVVKPAEPQEETENIDKLVEELDLFGDLFGVDKEK